MKGKWISVLMALALVGVAFGVLPAPRALAAAATTTYDYVPTYVPDDQTPLAVRVTFSNLTVGQCYVYKVRLYKTSGTYYGETWNATSVSWIATGGTYSTQNQFSASATSQSFWVYVRNTTLAASTAANDALLAIVASSNGTAACNSAPTFANGTPPSVTIMKMTTGGTPAQFGGWIDESNGTARAGRAIAVKSGTTIVGMYVAEDNGMSEGYGAAPYYKVAVPIGSDYTVETWDLAVPGTAVGKVNTMGADSCPNTVTAGAVTSMNACSTPTAVTLRTLTASAPLTPLATLPVAALALAGGVVVWRHRREA